jgi:hypothetical protein
MLNAGDFRDDGELYNRVKNCFDSFISGEEKRRKQSLKMKQIVDGKGAERLVERLLNLI